MYGLGLKIVFYPLWCDSVKLVEAVPETGIEVVKLLLWPIERDETLGITVADVDDALDDLIERGVL